jgi:hypothetical protein
MFLQHLLMKQQVILLNNFSAHCYKTFLHNLTFEVTLTVLYPATGKSPRAQEQVKNN